MNQSGCFWLIYSTIALSVSIGACDLCTRGEGTGHSKVHFHSRGGRRNIGQRRVESARTSEYHRVFVFVLVVVVVCNQNPGNHGVVGRARAVGGHVHLRGASPLLQQCCGRRATGPTSDSGTHHGSAVCSNVRSKESKESAQNDAQSTHVGRVGNVTLFDCGLM